MILCKKCGGAFKFSKMDYQIRTRHYDKPFIVLEDLPVDECTVCGEISIPPQSIRLIDSLKNKLYREIDERAKLEEEKLEQFSIKKALQKLL